jgi:hypothetical protein
LPQENPWKLNWPPVDDHRDTEACHAVVPRLRDQGGLSV